MAGSLAAYENLKPVYVALQKSNHQLRLGNKYLHLSLVKADSATAAAQRSYLATDVLYQDQKAQTQVWKGKAKRRNLKLLLVVTGVLAYITLHVVAP